MKLPTTSPVENKMPRVSTTTSIMRGFFILIFLLCANTSQASNIDETDPTTWPREKILEEIKETKEEHKFARLAQEVQYSHANIKGDANCSKALRLAEKYKKEMLALNQQYAGRANNEYQRRFTIAKKNNSEQLTKYRQCVSRVLFNSGKSKVIGVSTYDGLQNLTADIENRLDAKSVDDVGKYIVKTEDYLEELEAALKALGTNLRVVGTLTSVLPGVMVKPPGGHWREARKGYVFRVNDELKTDESGRARIDFTDIDRDRNAGPTIVSIGNNSHVRIEKLSISSSGKNSSKGVLGIIRGAIRAFTKSWGTGTKGIFSVRAGTTLVGIRGTEVNLDYNPDFDTFVAHVDHGTVDITSQSGKSTLTNREKITVKNGIAGNKTPFSQSEWTAVLQRTPDIGKVSLSDIANQISSRQLMGLQPPGKQVLNPPAHPLGSPPPFTPDEAICVARKVCKPNQEDCRKFIMGCGDNHARLSANKRDRCIRQRALIENKLPQCMKLNRQASDQQVPGQQVLNSSPPRSSSSPPLTPDEAKCIAKEFCKPMPSGEICWNHILECSEDQSRLGANERDRCRTLRKNTASIPLCINLK